MADAVAAEQEREALNTGTKDVVESHKFDEAALDRWMRANVEGYAGPLTVRQFKGGQSNPTYQLITPGRKYVLRRKPPGKLLPSAHAVDREYKVITALGTTGFPVAKTYGLCVDDGVIGTWFYIMDCVEGRIFWDQSLPTCQPAERHAIFMDKIKTLADLHNTDYVKIGLEDFGRPGNYMGRQVDRWTKQYKASETIHIPEIERLIEWLPTSLPVQERTSIVHGDYRRDNMVFHPTEPRVAAVLDWELGTLGNPLADFTYFLMNWINGSISHDPGPQGPRHPDHGRGGRRLLQPDRPRGPAGPRLVLRLQQLPPGRHPAGDRRAGCATAPPTAPTPPSRPTGC